MHILFTTSAMPFRTIDKLKKDENKLKKTNLGELPPSADSKAIAGEILKIT